MNTERSGDDPADLSRPDFSPFAEQYARTRPVYPDGLFDYLASQVRRRELAWDCATGNGQAAVGLARHFARVVGTDTSEEQLRFAVSRSNIEYRAAAAEASGLADTSADLVTVAAAVHWFDLDRFYAEARRVIQPGGVLAVWSYHASHVNAPFDAILDPFYRDIVGPYFAPGARLVDRRYEDLVLPGTPIAAPSFQMTARWDAAEIAAYVRNWSGTHAYVQKHGRDPVEALEGPLDRACAGQRRALRWPLYLRLCRL